MAKLKLVCWHCGESLTDEPLPISRFAKCRGCEADLRTCLMCTKFDTSYAGECRDENSDYVEHKDQANFCSFFRPSPFAFKSDRTSEQGTAKSELEALFGGPSEEMEQPQASRSRREKAKDSLSELERLFDSTDEKGDKKETK